jgi:hypothetical protein
MARPSGAVVLAAIGVAIAAGAALIAVGGIELSGQLRPDIWSNTWVTAGIVIVLAGAAAAVLVVLHPSRITAGSGPKASNGSGREETPSPVRIPVSVEDASSAVNYPAAPVTAPPATVPARSEIPLAPWPEAVSAASDQGPLPMRSIGLIVDEMLKVEELVTPSGLRHFLSLLPSDLLGTLSQVPQPRAQLVNVIRRCRRAGPSGREALVDALRLTLVDPDRANVLHVLDSEWPTEGKPR